MTTNQNISCLFEEMVSSENIYEGESEHLYPIHCTSCTSTSVLETELTSYNAKVSQGGCFNRTILVHCST